jgi:pSer/pThr/pTyr-binding forkhead associated (FHA) protein
MVKRRLFDWIIATIAIALCLLVIFYWREQIWLIIVSGAVAVIFIILGCIAKNKNFEIKSQETTITAAGLKQLILLNEDDSELNRWDLFGKTSLIIGRDYGENEVDINLADCTYSGFIEVEHAVLNYAGGHWFVEDLHSENGVRVQKYGDNRQYRLATAKPCRIDAGDIIYVAQTRLIVR